MFLFINMCSYNCKVTKIASVQLTCVLPDLISNYINVFYFISKKQINLMKSILPAEMHAAAPELGLYFVESWGNSTRLDYGTGMWGNACRE